MKFITFVDLHEDKKALRSLLARAKKDDIDFVICCGDLSTFGRGLKYVLKRFNTLKKKFYVIPGNHEEGGRIIDEAVKYYEYCINIHKKVIKIENYYLLGYGGPSFGLTDAEFRKLARGWYGKYKDEKTVLITHQPPFNTKLDLLGERHVGNLDYRKFIERIKPKLSISGHLHETVNLVDKIGKTKLIHPGWDGMVVELK
jgi:uncharacterized protein